MQAGMHTPRGYESFEFSPVLATHGGLPMWVHLTGHGQGSSIAVEQDDALQIIGGTDPDGQPFEGTWPNQEPLDLDDRRCPVMERARRLAAIEG